METVFKIAVCDDELSFLEYLYNRVERIMKELGYPCEIYDFSDSREFITHCRTTPVDVVLVDIDIPGKNGFEAVDELKEQQPDIAVIFVSSHEELAYQSFRYNPYQFVSKGDMDRLDSILAGLMRRLKRRREQKEIIYIGSGTGMIHINVNEVMYIKSDKNYIKAYGEDETEILKVREKLKNIYPLLSGSGFIYTHKSYIINCRFIRKFERKRVILINGREISNTRNTEMIDEAQRLYGGFIRELR